MRAGSTRPPVKPGGRVPAGWMWLAGWRGGAPRPAGVLLWSPRSDGDGRRRSLDAAQGSCTAAAQVSAARLRARASRPRYVPGASRPESRLSAGWHGLVQSGSWTRRATASAAALRCASSFRSSLDAGGLREKSRVRLVSRQLSGRDAYAAALARRLAGPSDPGGLLGARGPPAVVALDRLDLQLLALDSLHG